MRVQDMPEITMLSSMADHDFEWALDKHVEWGIRVVDLKANMIRRRRRCDGAVV